MEGGTTLGAKEGGGLSMGLRGAHADLAEATSRTDQQRAAGRGCWITPVWTEALRAPLFPSHSGHSSDRWSSDPGDAPRA